MNSLEWYSMAQKNVTIPLNQNTILVVALIAMAFFAGYLLNRNKALEEKAKTAAAAPAVKGEQQQAAPIDQKKVDKLFEKGYISFGDKNAKVKFVEVSDPSCPYCHIAGGHNPELAASAGEQFKYVSAGGTYVPPVTEIKKLVDAGKASFAMLYANGHGAGELAMQALYCAHDQGKFWETHDVLMSNAGYELINNEVKNDTANIGKLVTFIGDKANATDLTKCLTDGKYKARLASDQQLAMDLGFQGTPYFIINTTPYAGAYSYKDMESTVNGFLK